MRSSIAGRNWYFEQAIIYVSFNTNNKLHNSPRFSDMLFALSIYRFMCKSLELSLGYECDDWFDMVSWSGILLTFHGH